MKGTCPFRGCGEVVVNGIQSAMMELLDFINTTQVRRVLSIITIGIDPAKAIFPVHGSNESSHAELVKLKISCAQLLPLIDNLPPSLIDMEAYFDVRLGVRLFRQNSQASNYILYYSRIFRSRTHKFHQRFDIPAIGSA